MDLFNRLYLIILVVSFLIFGGLQKANSQAYGGGQLIFSKDRAPLSFFLLQAESDTSYLWSYSNKLDLSHSLSLPSTHVTVNSFLKLIADSCSLNYSIVGRKIILEPKKKRYFVVYGRVLSSETDEWLTGASIISLMTMKGTISNSYGFYSLQIEEGKKHDLGFSCIGYNALFKRFAVSSDTMINIRLAPNTMLEEVSIVSQRSLSSSNSQMSAVMLNSTQLKSLPTFVGESDLVKSLQMLPGVQGGSEGFGGFYVRGGGNEQNLFLLDDVPLYSISHLMGMFSVFNTDAINQVTVLRGGFPARYGGRVSSVVDIKLNEGNDKRLNGMASIGLSSAKFAFDGPAVRGKSTFNISVRRTFHDLLGIKIPYLLGEDWNFYFYDISLKYNHIFNPKSRVFVSFFTSYDKFSNSYNEQQIPSGNDLTYINTFDSNTISWGNLVGSFRWNYLFKSNLFMNAQVGYTRYQYANNIEQYRIEGNIPIKYNKNYLNGVRDGLIKVDFDYLPTQKHTIKFGLSNTLHLFQPGIEMQKQVLEAQFAVDTLFGGNLLKGDELHLYIEDDFDLGRSVKVNVGARMMNYFTENEYYSGLEPRGSLRVRLHSNSSFKAAYSRTSQFVHLVNASTISLPTDLWFPVTDKIKPLYSDLFTVGLEWDVFKLGSFSVEAYYKKLHNILDVKDGSGIYGLSTNFYDQLTAGDGLSKGVEFLYQIKTKRLMGWFGYTLSNTQYTFPDIDNGNSFPARFDRLHDVSLTITYKIYKNIDCGANWIFGTGNAVTIPSSMYMAPNLPTQTSNTTNSTYNLFGSRNNFRTPNYHRLDLSVTHTSKKRWGQATWSIGVYNAYGRDNAFFVYLKDTDEGAAISKEVMQLSIFPVPIPYVRYTAKF